MSNDPTVVLLDVAAHFVEEDAVLDELGVAQVGRVVDDAAVDVGDDVVDDALVHRQVGGHVAGPVAVDVVRRRRRATETVADAGAEAVGVAVRGQRVPLLLLLLLLLRLLLLLLVLLLLVLLLLLGHVVLDVFAQRTGVRVAFQTARHLAGVGFLRSPSPNSITASEERPRKTCEKKDVYRVDVGALVFGPVGTVGEGLAAGRVLAQVGLLARVRPQVDLEVLQTREGLGTAVVLRHPKTNKQTNQENGQLQGATGPARNE